MIYKAKESYFKLKDSENFCAHWSSNKHKLLVAGCSVEITSVPKSLEKHLERIDIKKKSKEDK
jgi:hypothetical protein|tara:strand:+ start:1883 stop:2071 length:189 start_codon:yes stop_codon:yes gene_type:complete